MSDCQFYPQETLSIVFRQGPLELSVEWIACPGIGETFSCAEFGGKISRITWEHNTGSGRYSYPVILVEVMPP